MLPPLRLIGHRLCPYVQRVAMVLAQNAIPHSRIDIALDDKPDWFHTMSPTGNVPVLVIDDDKTLFEAASICQYLDGLTWRKLYPTDAYERALHQGIAAVGEKILSLTADLIYRDFSEDRVDATLHQIDGQLSIVTELLVPRTIENNAPLDMLDMLFATIFRPFPLISVGLNRDLFTGFEGLRKWADDLARHKTVRDVVPPTYVMEMHAFVAQKNAYLASRLRMLPPKAVEMVANKRDNVIPL